MEFNSVISSVTKKKKIYHTSHNNSFFFIYPNMKKKKETQLTPFFSVTGHTQVYSVDVVNHQQEKQAEILDLSL